MGRISQAIEELNPVRIGIPCSIGAVFDGLDAEDQADLAVLFASDASGAHIGRVLGAAGFRVDDGSLRRHRNGGCKCAPGHGR